MPGLDTPQGQGLLSAAFSLMSAKKLPGQKGAFAGALGDAGQQYLQTTNTATAESIHAMRSALYEQLLEFFPESMKQPKSNLLDLIQL